MSPELARIDALAELMTRRRIRRVVASGTELELDASAFIAAPVALSEPAVPEPALTAFDGCPHDEAEHSELGCLRGCSAEMCARKLDPEIEGVA